MRSSTRLLAGLALGLALAPGISRAQSTLGELLAAGAKKVSAQELKRDVVQHAFAGPSPIGGTLEIAYLADGTIQGQGPGDPTIPNAPVPPGRVTGEWTIDDAQRLCGTMRFLAYGPGGAGGRGILPTKCEFWFKLGDTYFVSDSDKDRGAKVFRRTPLSVAPTAVAAGPQKPPSAPSGPEYSSVGELLDAGAKKISAEEFKRDVVQRILTGPTPTGGSLELMYMTDGMVQGRGTLSPSPLTAPQLAGEWTVDEVQRVCTAMRIGGIGGGVAPTNLPARCQVWFKLGDAYFIADSDTDRRAKVLRREVVHRSPGAVATPSNLGELLDAGAKRLSADEFKRDVVQRTLVGFWRSGRGIEMMYAANGSIQGLAQPQPGYAWNYSVSGEWSIGEAEKVCTALQMVGGTNMFSVKPSCQIWFKLGDDYFIADSDSDRRAGVFPRAIKR
jgi:hypothetical protein